VSVQDAEVAPDQPRERLGGLRVAEAATLRNVALTYPYFHDGAVDTLSEAVDTMGRLQLGKKFTSDENARIVAFLKTLTGDQPDFKLPALPPSSDLTPKPQPFASK
jgi:cytochrome c peroxidase